MNNEGSEVLTSCVCGADFLWYQEIDHVDLNKENIYLAGDKKLVFIDTVGVLKSTVEISQ